MVNPLRPRILNCDMTKGRREGIMERKRDDNSKKRKIE
jgi:hypothetical protein